MISDIPRFTSEINVEYVHGAVRAFVMRVAAQTEPHDMLQGSRGLLFQPQSMPSHRFGGLQGVISNLQRKHPGGTKRLMKQHLAYIQR